MSSKVAKTVLALVLLVVAGYFVLRSFSSSSPVASEYAFVDVATGEIMVLDMDKVGIIPAKNPKTGEWNLLPCKRNEKGVYVVNEPFRASLQDELKDKNRFVDPFTLEVKNNGN